MLAQPQSKVEAVLERTHAISPEEARFSRRGDPEMARACFKKQGDRSSTRYASSIVPRSIFSRFGKPPTAPRHAVFARELTVATLYVGHHKRENAESPFYGGRNKGLQLRLRKFHYP